MTIVATEWFQTTRATDNAAGGTRAWIGPENVQLHDYACASVNCNDLTGAPGAYLTHLLDCRGFHAVVPGNRPVLGVEWYVRREQVGGSPQRTCAVADTLVQVLKAGSPTGDNQAGTAWAATAVLQEVLYGGAGQLFGTAWTPAEINHPDTGIQIQITFSFTGSEALYWELRHYSVRLRVYYDDAAPSPDEDDTYQGDDEMSMRPSSPMIYVNAQTGDPYLQAIAAENGAVRTANVVTIATAAAHGFTVDDIGKPVTIAGVTDDSFNGTFPLKDVPTTTTIRYDQTAANATSANGTAALYPVIELVNGTKLRLQHHISGSGTTGGEVTVYSVNAKTGAGATQRVAHSGDGQNIKSSAQTASYESVYKNCGRYLVLVPALTDYTHTISYEEQV